MSLARVWIIGLAGLIALPAQGKPGVGTTATAATETYRTAALEAEMTAAVQQAVDKLPRIEGQGPHVKAAVRLDRQKMAITIHLSAEFRPDHAGAALEDQLSWLHNAADGVLRNKGLDARSSEITIGGQSLQLLFPDWFEARP